MVVQREFDLVTSFKLERGARNCSIVGACCKLDGCASHAILIHSQLYGQRAIGRVMHNWGGGQAGRGIRSGAAERQRNGRNQQQLLCAHRVDTFGGLLVWLGWGDGVGWKKVCGESKMGVVGLLEELRWWDTTARGVVLYLVGCPVLECWLASGWTLTKCM